MRSPAPLAFALLLAALSPRCAAAAELAGTVTGVAADTAAITLKSDSLPAIGDRVEIFFRIPGGNDEVPVASGTVSAVNASAVTVKIGNAAGTVAKNQLVRIISENPVKKTATPPADDPHEPPLPPGPAIPGRHVNIVPPGLIPARPGAVAGTTPAGAHVAQGIARFNAGDMDGAIAEYNEAIRLLPESGIAYFNRARARLSKGSYDAVIADADKALTLGLPNPADAFVVRGTARANKGDLDGAIADCDRAIRIDPKHALAYNNRANDRMQKRDWKGALADSNKAVSLDPNLALAYYNRGYARANSGDHAAAITDWSRAIQMVPGFQAELGKQIEISRSKQGRR